MIRQIVTRVGGGLGNQMFIYALGEHLARKLGVRQVFDITDFFVFKYLVPCGPHARRFELYDFKGPRKYKKWWAQYLFLPIWIIGKRIGWGVFERILKFLGMYWRHSEDTFRPEFSEIPNSCRLIYSTGINCDPTLMPDRVYLMREFALVKPVEGKSKLLEDRISACESVSVHVRRTDYLIQPTPWDVPFAYYERAIEHIARHVDKPSWFVFSDDPEWCKVRLAPLLGEFVMVEGNTTRPSIDLYLMSRCKHHIIANSTFSWWGAYLAPDIKGVTLYPEYWGPYVDSMPETFFPECWVKIKCDVRVS